METAYRLLRGIKTIHHIHRGIAPPMKILVNSRLKPPLCDDSTHGNCILTESWGCGEVKNVVLQLVQTAYKLLRDTKPILPIHHGIAPPIEIFVKSRLKPTMCDDCTNANCILTESWGCVEVKCAPSVSANSVQTSMGNQTHPSHPLRNSTANWNSR